MLLDITDKRNICNYQHFVYFIFYCYSIPPSLLSYFPHNLTISYTRISLYIYSWVRAISQEGNHRFLTVTSGFILRFMVNKTLFFILPSAGQSTFCLSLFATTSTFHCLLRMFDLSHQTAWFFADVLQFLFHAHRFVLYSYNKSQQDALYLNFISVKKNSTCFGQIYWPSSGILILYSQQLVFVILVRLRFQPH